MKRFILSLMPLVVLGGCATTPTKQTDVYPVASVLKQGYADGWDTVISLQNPEKIGLNSVKYLYKADPITEESPIEIFNKQKAVTRTILSTFEVDGEFQKEDFWIDYYHPTSYNWLGSYATSEQQTTLVTKQFQPPKQAKLGSSYKFIEGNTKKADGKILEIFSFDWSLKSSDKANNADLCVHEKHQYTKGSIDTYHICYTINKQGKILHKSIKIVSVSPSPNLEPLIFLSE